MKTFARNAVPPIAALLVLTAPAMADDAPAGQSLAKVAAPATAGAMDPKAKEIHDRGVEAVKKLDGVQMTSQLAVDGIDPSMIPPGATDPALLLMDFTKVSDGGLPFPRFTMEHSKDGKAIGRFVFDGKSALVTDEATKSYYTLGGNEWLMALGQRMASMPTWYLENRMLPPGAGEGMMPKIVEMALVGEETVDGKQCDMVKCVRAMELEAMDDESPEAGSKQEMRITETIWFAREDGLPRRVTSRTEAPGEERFGKVTSILTFSGVRANPDRDDAKFAVAAPEGYAKAAAEEPGAPAEPELKVKAGDAAPAFELADLAGKKVSLESLRGKVVLLDFWATWCGPCKAAMPAIQKIHDDYKDKGVAVLGVNTWENKEDAAKQYIEKKGFTYPCLLKGDDLAKAYGMSGIPTLVVIGKDGKIVDIEVGMAPGGDAGLRKAIDTALGTK